MGDVLLIGSSIFEQWYNCESAFPGRSVRNLAVGGTGTQDWQEETLLPLLQRERPGISSSMWGVMIYWSGKRNGLRRIFFP